MISAPAISRFSRKKRAKFPSRRAEIPADFPVDSRRTPEKSFSRKTSRSDGKFDGLNGAKIRRCFKYRLSPPIHVRPANR